MIDFLKEYWLIIYGVFMYAIGNLAMYVKMKRKKGYQQGYNDGIDDFVEQITLPMDEEQIVDIVERLKHNFES